MRWHRRGVDADREHHPELALRDDAIHDVGLVTDQRAYADRFPDLFRKLEHLRFEQCDDVGLGLADELSQRRAKAKTATRSERLDQKFGLERGDDALHR